MRKLIVWNVMTLDGYFEGPTAWGFLLAGTLADYKESHKLPGDLAASLETIADECQILYADKRAHRRLGRRHRGHPPGNGRRGMGRRIAA